MSRADEAAWREYVAGELRAFYDHCDGTTYIWKNTPAADRLVARLGGDSELAPWRSRWDIVAPHVTAEFRQWMEEYRLIENRLTPSEYRARGIADRADIAYSETADYALGQLTELRRLIAERDALIVEASKRGAAKTAIASAVGLSRQQIHTIVATAEIAPVIPIRPAVAEYDAPTEWVTTASGESLEVF